MKEKTSAAQAIHERKTHFCNTLPFKLSAANTKSEYPFVFQTPITNPNTHSFKLDSSHITITIQTGRKLKRSHANFWKEYANVGQTKLPQLFLKMQIPMKTFVPK